jgi:formylglycine-generating enzyme required for sulfatase activity
MRHLLALVALLSSLPAHAYVAFDWITVGDPGNTCETQTQGCFGAVSYTYRIGKYEVTNAQYIDFLNAVAATDTHSLYSLNMGSGFGGIARSGSSGNYIYSAITGRENLPVNHVSFWDVVRFANWLHNGQPAGAQDNTTTEDGAYTLSPTGISNNTVTRNAGATFFVTSEDEWYKAAYYAAGSMSYFAYPAGSNTLTTCAVPVPTPNAANCESQAFADLSDVGSYTGSPSPNGTFDQGGNVWEWNESIISGSNRALRGGSFFNIAANLAASDQLAIGPLAEDTHFGFRVASAVPSVPALAPLGLLVLAACALSGGTIALRRRSQ